MPTRTRQPNNRRPSHESGRSEPQSTVGIPEQWQQPSKTRTNDRRTRSSSSRQRPAEPSQWQQSPDYGRQSSRRQPADAVGSSQRTGSVPARRRKRKKRPPLSTVLFPKRAQRARSRRRRRSAPDSRAERQRQRLKRQRRYLLLHKLFTLVLIFGMGLMALTLFFKVETVSIEGHSRYMTSQLLETAAIEQGDNLFLLSRRAVRKRLLDEYPYLDTVRVERKLPNQIAIHVEDATPAAAVGSGETYYYMDASGKLLEQVRLDQLGSIPVVTGVTVSDVEVGKTLNMKRDERLQQLTVLLTALEEQGLMAQVDFINLSDMNNVRIGYGDHMYIRFGTMEDLARKMRFAKKFIEETSPSLYCEIEVSGEILWEGHPSYRVIPVSAEEVAAQSRDLDSAIEPVVPEENPEENPMAAPSFTSPIPEESDGEEAQNEEEGEGGQPSASGASGSNRDSEDESGPGEDGTGEGKAFPSVYLPGSGGSGTGTAGNWRTGS